MNKWILVACAAAVVAVVAMKMNNVKADAVEQAPVDIALQEEMLDVQPDAPAEVVVAEEISAEPAAE